MGILLYAGEANKDRGIATAAAAPTRVRVSRVRRLITEFTGNTPLTGYHVEGTQHSLSIRPPETQINQIHAAKVLRSVQDYLRVTQ